MILLSLLSLDLSACQFQVSLRNVVNHLKLSLSSDAHAYVQVIKSYRMVQYRTVHKRCIGLQTKYKLKSKVSSCLKENNKSEISKNYDTVSLDYGKPVTVHSHEP